MEPETLYRAVPGAKETVWYSGSEFVTQTDDGIAVSVALENALNGVMTYYIVIGNLGNGPVLVAPEQIHCESECYRLREVEDYNTGDISYEPEPWRDTVYAIDAEKKKEACGLLLFHRLALFADYEFEPS